MRHTMEMLFDTLVAGAAMTLAAYLLSLFGIRNGWTVAALTSAAGGMAKYAIR